LKKILLRNVIVGSAHANCLTFEAESAGSIFSIKWNKRNAPLAEEECFLTADEESLVSDLSTCVNSSVLSSYKEAIHGYIAGFGIKRIMRTIRCPICVNALSSMTLSQI
jgi:hypothetical protein